MLARPDHRPHWLWHGCLALMLLLEVAANGRALAASSQIAVYDARSLRNLDVSDPSQARQLWDSWHVLAALQGLVNRTEPQLYVLYCREFDVETDEFWLDWYRNDDTWLRQCRWEEVASLDKLLATYRPFVRGLVVYDEDVPATSNAASTAAGVEDLLPVRFDADENSLYTHLTRDLGLPVEVWLINTNGSRKFTGQGRVPDLDEPSSGSAKIDVYRWEMARYLQPGKCNPEVAAYSIDAFWLQKPRQGPADLHTLSNHDYFIAHRAFFFDLSAWADETPNDDPHQSLGLDRATLFRILQRLNELDPHGMIKIGGFTPWPFKYTDAPGVGGKHGGVPTEWEFSRIISEFNAYVEADAAGLSAMANASFHQHYPLRESHPQSNPKPDEVVWRERGWLDAQGRVVPRLFVGHYVGDYDSPAWLYRAVPRFFRDGRRGEVALGWAFNPNLADRAPQAMAYARKCATTNDYFIAGNSGAGYVNPRALTMRPNSELSSGLDRWTEHCQRYYRQWDLTITGFMLDGSAGASTDLEYAAYARFSPDGIGTHYGGRAVVRAGVGTCQEEDLAPSAHAAADRLAAFAREHPGSPAFFWSRSILKSPTWYAQVSEQLRERHPDVDFDVVDPYSFFGLIQRHLAREEP